MPLQCISTYLLEIYLAALGKLRKKGNEFGRENKGGPENTLCIAPKGGLGERREAGEIDAQALGAEIVREESWYFGRKYSRSGTWDSGGAGEDVIVGRSQVYVPHGVGRESEKNPQRVRGSPSIMALSGWFVCF